jgi:hypothetical protein
MKIDHLRSLDSERQAGCSPTPDTKMNAGGGEDGQSITPSSPPVLEQIIHAVLYEGYILYPYRASSRKNQRERFTFGRVYPKIYSDKHNSVEPWAIEAQCLFQTGGHPAKLEITAGFLQPVLRQVGRMAGAEIKPVAQLEVNGAIYQTWLEAAERSIPVILSTDSQELEVPFAFGDSQEWESIPSEEGRPCGAILRQQAFVEGAVTASVLKIADNLFKVSVRVENRSPLSGEDLEISENVLRRCFASTHVAFHLEGGQFISMLDTPSEFKAFADSCKNKGVWPVLIGDEDLMERHTMLASPIILYDYPRIAPDSAGDFFDGTEIDEMLTLRVLTMTEQEKREMCLDDFSRGILERTHALDADGFLKLHGRMQPLNPGRNDFETQSDFFNPASPITSVLVKGTALKAGDRVSIHPKRRADAMDLMLAGKVAIIEALEQDAEKQIYLALVLEDDPGRDLGLARQSGHRFFYRLDEVEPAGKGQTP